MTWLSRTLPVSAVVHMAAAVPLFLFPVFSGDMLPEPRREPLTVLAAPPLPRAQPIIAVRPVGRRLSREAPAAPAAAREVPALPPTMMNDASDPRVSDVLDDVGTDPGSAEPGSSGAGEGVGLSMGDGSVGSGDGAGAPQSPVRAGGDLEPPTKLRQVAPIYPELARQARVQGVVVLDCVIDPSGRVADVKVLRGHSLLAPAAVDAVRQWLYTPTRLNGVPVAVLLTVTVRFTLPR
jgi:periplasmic protein TonB